MSLRVLIVPDKFKGTLTAWEAAEAIARGWRAARPQDALELLPMSDGGDGFGEILSRLLGAAAQTVHTVDAAHRPCAALWWWAPASQTAVIESAQIIGLTRLPPKVYHPFDLDTAGLAEALRQAARHGARQVWLGLGGSATNDAGFGVAHALGWRFLDAAGEPIRRWPELTRLHTLVAPLQPLPFEALTVAVDVRNPLLGPEGATRVYGPQKGLRPEDFPAAEAALGRLAEVAARFFQADHATAPGAGAAGGLGFGLRGFTGARLESGFEVFARLASLPQRIRASHLVLTGEGALDQSTLMGKGVGEVARLCRTLGVPCLGLGGRADEVVRSDPAFAAVHALAPDLTTPAEAMAQPAFWLERLATRAAAAYSGEARGEHGEPPPRRNRA